MSRSQGVQDAGSDLEGAPQGKRSVAGDFCPQRVARNELHREVVGVTIDPLIQDRHDARVCQACGGSGLTAEPGHDVGPVGQVGVHDLECDMTIETPIACEVDRGHPAARDPSQHVIATVDRAADERIRSHGAHRG